MDEGADVHVVQFGGADSESQFLELLIGQSLAYERLPDLVAKLIFHIGRYLADTLLAHVIVFCFFNQFVEALVGDCRTIDFTHVGDAAIVLGQVTDDECNDSCTDDGDSYP